MFEVLETFQVHEMLMVYVTFELLELVKVQGTQRFSRFYVSYRMAEVTLCSQQCTPHPCTP